ncbi:MAG: hypothetical protein ACOCP5_02080 [Halanaerobiaceae bacterium]
MVESFTIILVFAVIVEVVTNGVKAAFPTLKGNRSRIIAAIIGVTICITTKIGILSKLDVEIKYYIIDYILTGIVISRGSNAVHDIISVFDKQNTKII